MADGDSVMAMRTDDRAGVITAELSTAATSSSWFH